MSDSVLVEGLRFAYPPLSPDEPGPWVIDGLDLRVRPGEWLAVMGASDVGKTTLCLLLAGLAPHLTGGTMEGQIVVAGRDTRQNPPPALADTVGLLFQEPEAQLFNPTVEAEVAWGLENLGLPVDEIQARVDAMLALLRLDHARHRVPSELSGGEKKRLALASVLAMRPSLLILDEPMGGLDPAGRAQVLAALADLRGQSGDRAVTIVMTESDPEAVAAFADRLVVLHRPSSLLAPNTAVGPAGERPRSSLRAESQAEGSRIALEGSPRSLFHQTERLAALGVAVPQMAQVGTGLNQHLGSTFDFLTADEARTTLAEYLD